MGPCFRRDDKWEYHLHASNSLPCPDTVSRSRGAFRPRFAVKFPPSPIRGRREHRVHAAPAVSCATVHKKTHTSIQVQRRQSGIPCAMVLRLISHSPRRSGFLVTVAGGVLTANLTPASRRQDHTTLPSASAPIVHRRLRVHRIPPRVRDVAQRPSV